MLTKISALLSVIGSLYETGEKIELSESEFEVLKEGKLVKRRVEE